jgi:hypothetical protein
MHEKEFTKRFFFNAFQKERKTRHETLRIFRKKKLFFLQIFFLIRVNFQGNEAIFRSNKVFLISKLFRVSYFHLWATLP